MDKIVYICHAVDTEGPLDESLAGSFNRIKEQLGIEIKPSQKNLEKIRNKSINLDGQENAAAELVRKDMTESYLRTWDQIDKMHEKVMSKKWRAQFLDSY